MLPAISFQCNTARYVKVTADTFGLYIRFQRLKFFFIGPGIPFTDGNGLIIVKIIVEVIVPPLNHSINFVLTFSRYFIKLQEARDSASHIHRDRKVRS